jgi:signal transduction histidine kinase
MGPGLNPLTWSASARDWVGRSVRHKLLAMALGPLLVVFPLLVAALTLWGNAAYDRLLITKVRSDLAVAHGYFDKVLNDVGLGAQAVGNSHRLLSALQTPGPTQQALARRLGPLLEAERQRHGLDFLRLYALSGAPLDSVTATATDPLNAPPHAPAGRDSLLPAAVAARLHTANTADTSQSSGELLLLQAPALAALAPQLVSRTGIALVPTSNASPTERTRENRAMVGLSVMTVRDLDGRPLAILTAGVLLNQNLDFIDHINAVVYPEGSLPFGSQGTATLFLEDVRITTNVRLFQDQRAIGTRVSGAVRDAVLTQGQTWLDRAFVVNDWYVSAYQPLLDSDEHRIGMLYVGYLERPFRLVRFGLLGVMALIFLAVMALATVLSVRWARSIFKPVERMNQVMQQVEDGQPDARVGPLAARDELGALASHLDQLLDVVADKTATLERWGQQLDQRVTERTAELAASNESLKKAQQQLVHSEKLAVMGQLAASVAHEINNPIAVMQGNLDLMRDTLGTTAEPVRAEMKLLDEQVERIRLIVQQLLQHARPEEYAGYVEALNVNDALSACLVLVNHRLANARIQVVMDTAATQTAAFNRQELQQVFINLLINAANAMPQGGVLTLRTRDWCEPPETRAQGVVIEVQDTGPGLAPDTLARLFQPFFTTRRDGNGLGLWISRGLVERYGGDIRARNAEPGPGAVFAVQLLSELAQTASTDSFFQ